MPVETSLGIAGRSLRVEGGDSEQLAGALAVRGGDDGRVELDETALLEEAVDRLRRTVANPHYGAQRVGSHAQVTEAAQELEGMPLLLERVVVAHAAHRLDPCGVDLEALPLAG